ncbi:hypothetical protein DFH06DRAFT_1142682 [Mycena polygramma]|nr:hypothetical protein DFH06DRAFT_1142682 [Mycena polygramma]
MSEKFLRLLDKRDPAIAWREDTNYETAISDEDRILADARWKSVTKRLRLYRRSCSETQSIREQGTVPWVDGRVASSSFSPSCASLWGDEGAENKRRMEMRVQRADHRAGDALADGGEPPRIFQVIPPRFLLEEYRLRIDSPGQIPESFGAVLAREYRNEPERFMTNHPKERDTATALLSTCASPAPPKRLDNVIDRARYTLVDLDPPGNLKGRSSRLCSTHGSSPKRTSATEQIDESMDNGKRKAFTNERVSSVFLGGGGGTRHFKLNFQPPRKVLVD